MTGLEIDAVESVITCDIGQDRAHMHLDTVATMLDVDGDTDDQAFEKRTYGPGPGLVRLLSSGLDRQPNPPTSQYQGDHDA